MGSSDFESSAPHRFDKRLPARVLLVGHSHDPDLSRIATLLCERSVVVEALLVDRIGQLPTLEYPTAGASARYDVAYCRGFRPDQFVHFHFDRTLRRSEDWRLVDSDLVNHAADQAQRLIWNWLSRISVGRWVNSPWSVRDADDKLTQLSAAQATGLTVPATLVTGDVDQLHRFAAKYPDGVIHKSLNSPVISQRERDALFLYTTPAVVDDIETLPYPSLFQQRLIPRRELRVTLIGRRTFAAAVSTLCSQQTDWRRATADHQRFEHHQLSEPLVSALHDLMTALGIQVGAVDLIETAEQTYFLEINPSAAFMWLERNLGMQLCQSVASLILCGA